MAEEVLSVRDLVVTGSSGRKILSIEKLVVHPGTAVGIQGPSGAGKSTLLFALAGLIPASSGQISWHGQNIKDASAQDRRKFRTQQIGFVFQDHHLFEELSAQQNADITALFSARSDRSNIKDSAKTWLERLGLPDIGRNSQSFSGGERQRIAVARALASDPAIILADEPTASLDRESANRLVDDLLEIVRSSGKTLIAVSHDEYFLSRMDRRVTIKDGTLVS